jgi:hypothetical protein
LKKVLLIFLDGVGIGKEDYEFNPFFMYGFKTFTHFFGAVPSLNNSPLIKNNFFLFPVNALLGIEGLPQSGTGQTSIFCGVNAPKIIGKHFGPYPYSTLVPAIAKENILKYFSNKGKKVSFVNAYPKVFFDYIKSGKTKLSVTTLMCRLNGMRLNRAIDVWKGNALTAEITNERWISRLNYKLPKISPKIAARRLLKISSKNILTVYEYFLTDHLGHGRYEGTISETLNQLDEFLFTIFSEFDKNSTTVIICSDHGNIEDISVKTHTLNPALMIAAGFSAESVFRSVKDISQIKKSIIKILT